MFFRLQNLIKFYVFLFLQRSFKILCNFIITRLFVKQEFGYNTLEAWLPLLTSVHDPHHNTILFNTDILETQESVIL